MNGHPVREPQFIRGIDPLVGFHSEVTGLLPAVSQEPLARATQVYDGHLGRLGAVMMQASLEFVDSSRLLPKPGAEMAAKKVEIAATPQLIENNRTDWRMLLKLSGREFQVACMAGDGLENREIAEALSIDEETAKSHIRRLRSKIRNAGFALSSTRVALANFINFNYIPPLPRPERGDPLPSEGKI